MTEWRLTLHGETGKCHIANVGQILDAIDAVCPPDRTEGPIINVVITAGEAPERRPIHDFDQAVKARVAEFREPRTDRAQVRQWLSERHGWICDDAMALTLYTAAGHPEPLHVLVLDVLRNLAAEGRALHIGFTRDYALYKIL